MAITNSVSDLYNLYLRTYGQSAGDEAGGQGFARPMSEAQFNALPEEQRFAMAGEYSNNATNVYNDGSGNLVGYGDPRFIEQGGFYDPSSVTRQGNRFSIASSGVNQDRMNDIQNQTDRSGFFSGTPLQNIARGMGIVAGVGTLNNLFGESLLGGGSAPTGGVGSAPTGGMLAESVAPTVTETMAASPFASTPWYQQLGQNLVSRFSGNPLGTASQAMQLGGLVGGLLGGNSGGQGGGSNYQVQGLLGGNRGGASGQSAMSGWQPNPYTMQQIQQLYGGR